MAAEDLDTKQMSKARAFWVGLFMSLLGLSVLYFDISGMLHKTEVPFLKRGLDYAQSPNILFWASGIIWFFLSILLIYKGLTIFKKAFTKSGSSTPIDDELL